DVQAFHEFQSLVGEPWDGPSALAFADGRFVGAALDRNGFRPARLVRTAAGLIAAASEVGVLHAAAPDNVDRDRPGPGDVLAIGLERGAVLRTNDIHRRLAFKHRYRQMVDATARTLPQAALIAAAAPAIAPPLAARGNAVQLRRLQAAFGCSREE